MSPREVINGMGVVAPTGVGVTEHWENRLAGRSGIGPITSLEADDSLIKWAGQVKGFDEKAESYGEYITRSGDIRSPRIANKEPLRIECEHFVDSIRTGTKPRSDGEAGLRVVRVLAGLQESLKATQ